METETLKPIDKVSPGEPLRHRQTKGAATDMFYLTPPRHISTLPFASMLACLRYVRYRDHF
jgi:hypothetical protein